MTTALSRHSERRISPVFLGIVAVTAVTGWATWTGFAEQPGLAVFLFFVKFLNVNLPAGVLKPLLGVAGI